MTEQTNDFPTENLKCLSCKRLTTYVEAATRKFNTGRCGYCGGSLKLERFAYARSENEILARWLDPERKRFTIGNTGVFDSRLIPVGFRVSNEWAGALLERLYPCRFTMWSAPGSNCWAGDVDGKPFNGTTWRDAVVDAALQVIERESQDDEGEKP